LPWWLPALRHGAAEGLVLDAGRLPAPAIDGFDLALGRLGDLAGLAAPWPLGVLLPVLALLALVPRTTRIAVLVCWVVVVAAAVTAAVLAAVSLDLAPVTTGPGLTALLVVVQAALVVATVLGALGVVDGWRDRKPLTKVATALVAVVAIVVPLGGVVWFVGFADHDLDEEDDDIPAYMMQAAETGPEHGILVVRGSVADGLTYSVVRGDAVTVGEDEVLALAAEDDEMSRTLQGMASRPTPAAVDDLAARGIEYVVQPAPADPDVAASLDATSGLLPASADRSSRAWQVDRPLATAEDLAGTRSWLRIGLIVLQGFAIITVAVLCAPTTERRRRR
jgi:hypothetical protein